MAHSRDSNPKCLLSPRAKIPTISREEMKCHWEELLGRQKFGVRPLRQEARTSKNKNWGGVTGRTKTFQGAHWQRKHQNSALSQSKRLQRDYTAQSLVCDMKGPSLWAKSNFQPWDCSDRRESILFPLHLHSLILFIIYFMHTFLLRTAVPAKFMDFIGSQPSVFNYHHLSYIWLRP